MTATAAVTFAAVFVALYVGHDAGDHWVQHDGDARRKGELSWAGRLACTRHVLTLTLTQLACITAASAVLHLGVAPGRVAAGLIVNAMSHWIIDRRWTLAAAARFADRLGLAKSAFLMLGVPRAGRDDNPSLGTGGYVLDQSAHKVFVFVAALVIAA